MFKITNRYEIITLNKNGKLVYKRQAIPNSNFNMLLKALFN